MDTNLFSQVSGDYVSDPGQLPFQATHPDGRIFTALAEQLGLGNLTLSDIALFGFYPATLEELAYDPETESPTELTKTVDHETRTVTAVRGKRTLTEEEIQARYDAAHPIPDNPTLGDWRVAMVLWGRLPEIIARIKALVEAGHPLGPVVQERIEYSNNVLRAELMVLREALGFSEEEVIESLWRADRVRQGDLSGVWPLQAAVPAPAEPEPEQPADPVETEQPAAPEEPVVPAEPEVTAA